VHCDRWCDMAELDRGAGQTQSVLDHPVPPGTFSPNRLDRTKPGIDTSASTSAQRLVITLETANRTSPA
jgi:hypothetical protein